MAARADRDEEKTLPRSSASGSAATPHRGGRIGACANSACTLRPHASDMVRVIEVSFLNVLYFKFGFDGVFEVLMYGSLREGAVSEAD